MDEFVSIDYEYARRLADRLKSLDKDCSNVENRIHRVLMELSLHWEGKACEEFERQLRNKLKDISRARDDINEVASLIRRVVNAIEEKDEELRRKAEELNASLK